MPTDVAKASSIEPPSWEMAPFEASGEFLRMMLGMCTRASRHALVCACLQAFVPQIPSGVSGDSHLEWGMAASSSDGAPPTQHAVANPGLPGSSSIVQGSVSLGDIPPMGHKPRLHLDWVSPERMQLTDVMTQEIVSLPEGSWELVIDSDDRAALLQGEEFRLVEDLMRFDVFDAGSEGLCIGWSGQEGDTTRMSFETWRCRHSSGEVTVHVGSTRSEMGFATFIFRRPRAAAMRVYWLVYELYVRLSLSSYKGQRSKWAYACHPKWEKFLAQSYHGNLFIGSKHLGGESARKGGTAFSERMLPSLGCSTVALLSLLRRWSFCSEDRGGLKEARSRDASRDILEGLLAEAVSGSDGVCLEVFDVEKWVCMWPRPSVGPDNLSVKLVLGGGRIDMSQFLQLPGPASTSKHFLLWRRAFVDADMMFAAAPSLSLIDFKRCAGVQRLASMSSQVKWLLARRLEQRIVMSEREREPAGLFQFRKSEIGVGGADLDEQLYAYVSMCRLEAQKHNFVSIATDKASVCGSSLQNTTITFEGNHTLLCCPNVAICL